MTDLRGARQAAAGVLALLALTGCGSQVAGATDTTTPGPAGAPAKPVPAPTWVPTDVSVPVDGGPCQPSQVRLEAGLADYAAGYREMAVTATNVSRVRCFLKGFPQLTFYAGNGERVALKPRPGELTSDQDVTTARTVELRPERQASVRLGWRGDLASVEMAKTEVMRMTVTRGSAPQVIVNASRTYAPTEEPTGPDAVPSPSITQEQPIDIVEGTEVRIGGWRLVTPQ